MAKLKMTCPACGTTLTVAEVHLGKTGRCKQCGAKFPIKRPEARAAPGVEHQPPDVTIPQGQPKKAEDIKLAEDQVAAEWNVGDVILDTYEVKQVHTGGGMGLVYRVHHRNWNMDLAVKGPRSEFFATEEQKADFIRECETWINLGLHPNIVSCYYVRTLGGIPRMFAEYVEGGSLKDWIDSRKLYEGGPDEALKCILDIAIQMAWGLHYAHEHEQHLIHQDFKPPNVMMMPDGEAKVTDFGLARARAAAGDGGNALGTEGLAVTYCGLTQAYCSPEQAEAAAMREAGIPDDQWPKLTPKTDTWSWAVSVLDMFYGRRSCDYGQAALDALDGLPSQAPGDDRIPAMPPRLAQLLRRCLQYGPDERPEMASVAAELKAIYERPNPDGSTGEVYPREEPKAAELLADGLNNRAVSMIDLGRKEEAEQLFGEALQVDGHHPEATYNRGLLWWRSGRLADSQLVQELEKLAEVPMYRNRAGHLKGLVHLERGDAESATMCLREVADAEPSRQETKRDLERARSHSGCQLLRALEAGGHKGPRPASNGGDIFEQMLGLAMRNLRESVETVAIDSNGRWCVSGGAALSLWDVDTGECLRTQKIRGGPVTAIGTSVDFLKVVAGTQDGRLLIWRPQTGECSEMNERHTSRIGFIAVTENGDQVRSACWGGEVRLWGLRKRDCRGIWRDQDHGGTCIAVTPDGRRAVCGKAEFRLCLWDLSTGRGLRTFDGHVGPVISAAVSPDGRCLLSGSGDGTLRLWELSTGRCLRILEGHTDWVTSVAFTSDGLFGLSGSADKTLRFWDLISGRCIRTFEGHTNAVHAVAVTPDGRRVVTGGADATTRVWDIGERPSANYALALPRGASDLNEKSRGVRRAIKQMEDALRGGNPGGAISILGQARRIVGHERDPSLLGLWRKVGSYCRRRALRGCWRVRTLRGHDGKIMSMRITPDGRFALSGGMDATARLWDLVSGRCQQTLGVRGDPVMSVAISPDGKLGLAGGADGRLRSWQLESGECSGVFEGHEHWVSSVALGPGGGWALSGSRDSTLRTWNLVSGKSLQIFKGHRNRVTSVAVSPDGRYVVSGSYDSTVRLWEADTGICVTTIECGTPVMSVSVSHDARWAVIGGLGGFLRAVDLAEGRGLQTFESHCGRVTATNISPEDGCVLAGDDSGTLRLWGVAKGVCWEVIKMHREDISSVEISRDGRWVVSASGDGTIERWELDWELEFPGWADWDEGARAYLEIFLTLHCPYGKDGISRVGKPTWNDEDFEKLIKELQYRGYGWLRPEGVRLQLERIAQIRAERSSKKRGLREESEKEAAIPRKDRRRDMASLSRRTSFAVYQRAARDGDTTARKEAMTALARLARESGEPDKTKAVEELIRALDDTEREIRSTAATLLGLVGDSRAADALALALKDNDQGVAHSAALSLASLGDARGKDNLVATLGAIRKALQNASPERKEVLKPVEAGIVEALEKIQVATPMPTPRNVSKGKSDLPFSQPVSSSGPVIKQTKTAPKRLDANVVCSCGADNPPANTFCVACGKRLPKAGPSNCPHCGKPVPGGIRFCVHCGKETGA